MASRDDLSNLFLNSDTICDDFFIEIVEKKLEISRNEFKLRLVMLSPATGKNENYMSVLYRANIKIEILEKKEKKSVDVIIKALLTTIKEIKEFGVFPRERFMYEDVLTSFEKIWLERGGEVIQFGPKSIKFETDPYEIIVLDDLKADNYEMLDRKIGLNMAQTKTVLTKLAKFHAASAIRYQKDGQINSFLDRKNLMPAMDPSQPIEESPFYNSFMKMFEGFVENVRKYEGFELYAEKIAKWDKTKLMTQYVDCAEPMRCGFQVLNHGDTWLNNLMFKSDDNKNPTDLRLIDHQMPFWASPTSDILYFLISSVADGIKVEHFDDFVEFYHQELSSALKILKYDQHIPTLAELHIDFLDKGSFACSCLMVIMFVVKYDSPEEMSMEILMLEGGSPEMMNRIYGNECYRKALQFWLPFMNKRGFLDTMMVNDKPEEIKKKD